MTVKSLTEELFWEKNLFDEEKLKYADFYVRLLMKNCQYM